MRTVGSRLSLALKSPFGAPCLWIGVAMSLYALRWSYLYSPLDPRLIGFLVGVLVIFAVFAVRSDSGRVRAASLPTDELPLLVITAYFSAAFIANGGVPVVQILLGRPYDIYGFGIPGLHVIMLAFTSYQALRYLRRGLATRDKRAIAAYVAILAIVSMMASRSAVSFIVFASVVMFLRAQRLSARRVTAGLLVLVGFLFVFGQFGNARLAYQIEQETGEPARDEVVLIYAEATPAFERAGLDAAWMWPYLYFSSPLANLNSALDGAGESPCGDTCAIDGLVLHEMLPDVVGVRLADALDVPEFDKTSFLVKSDVTASTTFGSAVGYAGILGAGLVAALLLLLALVTTRLLRESPLREEGLAILSTVLFFSFFENMVSYSPLSLQLVIVLVASATITRNRLPAPAWGRWVPTGTGWRRGSRTPRRHKSAVSEESRSDTPT